MNEDEKLANQIISAAVDIFSDNDLTPEHAIHIMHLATEQLTLRLLLFCVSKATGGNT
jgi:hypothetical protein